MKRTIYVRLTEEESEGHWQGTGLLRLEAQAVEIKDGKMRSIGPVMLLDMAAPSEEAFSALAADSLAMARTQVVRAVIEAHFGDHQ